MMLTKRIIAGITVAGGQAKTGVNFANFKNAGDPLTIAKRSEKDGADELFFIQIPGASQNRLDVTNMIENVSTVVFMPLTVGYEVQTADEVSDLLKAGADRLLLHEAPISNPQLITDIAKRYGSETVVAAINTKYDAKSDRYMVYSYAANKLTDLDAVQLAQRMAQAGAGELLVTSIDQNGAQSGFNLDLYQRICAAVHLPVIASGGAGSSDDFVKVFTETPVTGALAGTAFVSGETSIQQVKKACQQHHVLVR